jgi:hypothetical protein
MPLNCRERGVAILLDRLVGAEKQRGRNDDSGRQENWNSPEGVGNEPGSAPQPAAIVKSV